MTGKYGTVSVFEPFERHWHGEALDGRRDEIERVLEGAFTL